MTGRGTNVTGVARRGGWWSAAASAWLLRRPRRRVAPGVVLDAGLPVPAPGGATLYADRWSPEGQPAGPVVLVRSPYGRRFPWGLLYGRPLAHAGWNVVVASCRGAGTRRERFEEPAVHERADAAATVEWLRRQDFFDGRLATIGVSYLGFTQWALAADPPPELVGMVVQAAPHDFASANWPGGVFALADTLEWAALVSGPRRQVSLAGLAGTGRSRRRVRSALDPERPGLAGASAVVTGRRPVRFWEEWAAHPPPDPWWAEQDCSAALERVSVPVLVQGGWHDLFRRPAVAQYTRLAERGVPSALTMGPWTHAGLVRAWRELMSEAADWLDASLTAGVHGPGAAPVPLRTGVRAAPLGGRGWRSFPSWPPPGTSEARWALAAGGGLVAGAGAAGRPGASGTNFRYDPADPTPSLAGALLGAEAGARDNRSLEARADVTVWTSSPLPGPVEVAGTVTATVWAEASGPHDLFVRLCDVHPDGRSVNVCDGIAGWSPRPAGPAARAVTVDLGPVVARFDAGHRLRLQVSAGAFPRYARRVGGGPVTVTVRHDLACPSAVTLAVL